MLGVAKDVVVVGLGCFGAFRGPSLAVVVFAFTDESRHEGYE